MPPSFSPGFSEHWPGEHACPPPTPVYLLSLGKRVEAWCGVCNVTRPVDLAALVVAGRGDHDIIAMQALFKCETCGFRNARLAFG